MKTVSRNTIVIYSHAKSASDMSMASWVFRIEQHQNLIHWWINHSCLLKHRIWRKWSCAIVLTLLLWKRSPIYTISRWKYTLSSIYKRAGGGRADAEPPGTKIIRSAYFQYIWIQLTWFICSLWFSSQIRKTTTTKTTIATDFKGTLFYMSTSRAICA